jgi:hypothetical protein
MNKLPMKKAEYLTLVLNRKAGSAPARFALESTDAELAL